MARSVKFHNPPSVFGALFGSTMLAGCDVGAVIEEVIIATVVFALLSAFILYRPQARKKTETLDPPKEVPPLKPNAGAEEVPWEQSIEALESQARAMGDDVDAAPVYLRIGKIWEDQLNKPGKAAVAYQRAFHLDSKDPAILDASRGLFTKAENWGMVVQLVGHQIEAADTVEQRAALHAEKATILEEKLGLTEEAEKAFRAALDAWPEEPSAKKALQRLDPKKE